MAIETIPLKKEDPVSQTLSGIQNTLLSVFAPFLKKNQKEEEENNEESSNFYKELLTGLTTLIGGVLPKNPLKSKKLRAKWEKYREKLVNSKWFDKITTGLKKAAEGTTSIFFKLLKALLVLLIIDPSGGFIASIIKFAGKMVAWIVRILIKHIPKIISAFINLLVNVLPPALKSAFTSILDSLQIPKDSPIRQLFNMLAEASPYIFVLIGAISILTKVIPIVTSIVGVLGGSLLSVVAVIGAVVLAFAGILIFGDKIQKFLNDTFGKDSLISVLFNDLNKIVNLLWNSLKSVFGVFVDFFNNIKSGKGIKESLITLLKDLGGIFWSAIKNLVPLLLNMIWNIVKSIPDILVSIISFVWDVIKTVGSLIGSAFSKIGNDLLSLFKPVTDLFSNISNYISNLFSSISDKLWNMVVGILVNFFKIIIKVKKFFKKTYKTIIKNLKKVGKSIMGFFKSIFNFIKVLPSKAWEFIKKVPSLIWDSIKNVGGMMKRMFMTVIDSLKDSIYSLVDYMAVYMNPKNWVKSSKEVSGELAIRQAARIAGVDYGDFIKNLEKNKLSRKEKVFLKVVQQEAGSKSIDKDVLEKSLGTRGEYREERLKKRAKYFKTSSTKTKNKSRG